MKTWILSIIGTVILITIAELLLPSGRMKNVTRSIFGVLVMIVILKPLPSIKNSDWQLDFDLSENTHFLDQVNERKVAALQERGISLLRQNGYDLTSVVLNGNWTDGEYMIETVIVYADQNLDDTVIKGLASLYGIDPGRILTYGYVEKTV